MVQHVSHSSHPEYNTEKVTVQSAGIPSYSGIKREDWVQDNVKGPNTTVTAYYTVQARRTDGKNLYIFLHVCLIPIFLGST